MSTKTYSQTSRDRLAANLFLALPVVVALGVIRYLQRPKPAPSNDVEPGHPL